MAFKLKDFVKETTTVTGTSANIGLDGAVAQYSAFSSFMADADTTLWFVRNADGSEWEARNSAYVASTDELSRAGTLIASSTGSAVNFTAGTKTVMCGLPAAIMLLLLNALGTGPFAATTSAAGASELATDAEAQAVTDTTRTLTPSNLAAMVATQANQEAGTANDRFVSPGRQHFHPSAAKAFNEYGFSSGTPTTLAAYNISGYTDNGVGFITVSLSTAFSSANYAAIGQKVASTIVAYAVRINSQAAGSVGWITLDDTGAAGADIALSSSYHGDQ